MHIPGIPPVKGRFVISLEVMLEGPRDPGILGYGRWFVISRGAFFGGAVAGRGVGCLLKASRGF